MKHLLIIILIIGNLFAFDIERGKEFTDLYSGVKVVLDNDKTYNLKTKNHEFKCRLLENKFSVCIEDKKNYILATNLDNGFFESNYLKFIELKFKF